MNGAVVEAIYRQGSVFVESASIPGAWYRVDYLPGLRHPFTCSCPRGRVIASDPTAKACRHLIEVCSRISDEGVAS